MGKVLNLPMLSHPLNWLLVWVILALASMAYTLVHNAVAHKDDASNALAI